MDIRTQKSKDEDMTTYIAVGTFLAGALVGGCIVAVVVIIILWRKHNTMKGGVYHTQCVV